MKQLQKIIILTAVLFLNNPVHAETYPMLELKWTYPIQSSDVYAFDFDRDGEIEIYSSKYDVVKSYLYVLDLEGNYLYKTWVDKVAQRKLLGCGSPERHAREKIMYFMPAAFRHVFNNGYYAWFVIDILWISIFNCVRSATFCPVIPFVTPVYNI